MMAGAPAVAISSGAAPVAAGGSGSSVIPAELACVGLCPLCREIECRDRCGI